jgi:hypothetical protein
MSSGGGWRGRGSGACSARGGGISGRRVGAARRPRRPVPGGAGGGGSWAALPGGSGDARARAQLRRRAARLARSARREGGGPTRRAGPPGPPAGSERFAALPAIARAPLTREVPSCAWGSALLATVSAVPRACCGAEQRAREWLSRLCTPRAVHHRATRQPGLAGAGDAPLCATAPSARLMAAGAGGLPRPPPPHAPPPLELPCSRGRLDAARAWRNRAWCCAPPQRHTPGAVPPTWRCSARPAGSESPATAPAPAPAPRTKSHYISALRAR